MKPANVFLGTLTFMAACFGCFGIGVGLGTSHQKELDQSTCNDQLSIESLKDENDCTNNMDYALATANNNCSIQLQQLEARAEQLIDEECHKPPRILPKQGQGL